MATTQQILDAVRRKILEESTDIVSDTDLLLYANFAYQDLARRVFPNSQIKTATVNFTSGTAINLPSDFGTLFGTPYDTSGYPYGEQSITGFTGGQFTNGVVYQGGQLKVLPTTTASLTVSYYPSFADISLVVNPSINSYFHELIIYGTLARVYEDLQDEILAKYYGDKYENMLAQKINTQSQYEEDNQTSGVLFVQQDLTGNSGLGWTNSPNSF